MSSGPVPLNFDTFTPLDSGRPVEQSSSNLRQSIAYGVQQNPDEYAALLKQQQATGMAPEVAKSGAAETQNAIDVEGLNPERMAVSHPRTATWATNPDNAAVSGADELHRLTRIEQHAATMSAYVPTWRDKISGGAQSAYEFLGGSGSLKQRFFEYPLTRIALGALRGTEETLGNFGSFFGIHGDNPEGLNALQRSARTLEPQNFGAEETDLDKAAAVAGPMIPAMIASGGTSLLARTLGLSDKAAKVFAGLSVGGLFTAEQGGRTLTAMKGEGATDYDARLAANQVAAINAPANALFGATEIVPFMRDNPLLTSVGLGGATGVSGQLSQNLITNQPWHRDLVTAAIQGAAMQAGMHIGAGFMENMGDVVSEVEQSKLRTRSPEKFQEALGKIFEGDESLRIPAEDFVNYFHGKELDPAEMANQMGVTNLAEAAAAGTDLEIPKANFFGKLDPEHQKGLLPDIVDPATEMTARQAQAGRAELEQWIADGGAEKLQAEYQQADAETQATPEWQSVYSDLKQRYVDAGETEPAADSYATLQANAIVNLARKAGMKPDELLALHNPKVTVAEAAPGEEGGVQPRYQEAVEGIRSVVEAAKQEGHAPQKAVIAPVDEWLAGTAKENGLDVDGYKHVVDGSAIRHVINRHGDEATEQAAGQVAVTDRDFENIPEVLAEPDRVIFGAKNGRGQDLIGYSKRMSDGSTLYIEEVRRGRKELAAVSMRKFPATMDADSVAASLHLDARNDGIEPIVVRHPSADKSDTLYQAAPGDSEGAAKRKARNIALAKIQGEILTGGEGKRGWFKLLPDGRVEIGKTRIGDVSTFIHEPAHAYLELFRELTQREGASEPLKDDFEKIANWLGTTPEEAYKNGFTREQHEQWARANEQYVREGKAPTAGLRRAFHNFAVWLGSIYRRASALGVELNGDIRGVMDRLYAGEDAVHRAEQETGQPLFENPEDAGWTEEQYRNYADAKGIAVDKAREQVRTELNEAAVRERTQDWREEKSNVRDAVTEQVDARPEYAAIRSLRRGSLDEGTELTLNRDALVKQFGEERVSALQQLHRGLYRNEGGTDADTAAELLGFGSGGEMMRALENAPRRALAIEQAVRDTMTARHGDVRYDGSLDEKARLAVENQERAKNLHRELTALRAKVASLEKKAADSKAAMRAIATLPLEQYQEAARQIVDGKTIADLQPYRYLNASRKFSREAFDALRKGDVKRAADAKNKELLNHFLFREASAASEYVDKFENYIKRVQGRGIQQRLGLADEDVKRAGGIGDFRDQFNWLLARYRLGGVEKAPERSLRDWADDVYGQGNEVAIAPGVLNEKRFVDYRNAPISEIRDVHEALVNIRHLATQQFKMFVQGKQIEFAEAKQEMNEAARTNLKSKPETIFEENRSRAAKLLSGLQYVDSRLIRMERLIEWLDGGKAGPWHDNLWNLASDAQGDEYKLQEQVTKQVTDALADMPAEMRKRLWTEKLSVEGIPEPLPRRRMLSIAFNMGNEGNLDRLKKTFSSFGWDPEAIKRIGGMLTREEWQFVQKAWESLKPLGERMKELEQRLTGLPPAMVKVTPFKVALDDGTEMELDGGYFPIAMDPRFSERAIQQDAKETAQNAMQSGYVRATTSKGYTKERTGFGGPLLLDYEQVLTSHVAKVAKDLSHREFMLVSQRFLLDTEVRKTLRETLGPAYEKQFMPWLRTIINDNNGSVQERLDGLKEGMQKLRGNVVAASLGFNASTSLLQISHAPRMLLYAKTGSLAQAFVDLLAHPIENSREIRELSPNEMKFRGDNLDRDIRAVLQNPEFKTGYSHKVAVAARFALEVMDHLLSHTLWKAAYRDSLDKYADLPVDEAHAKAAHEADSAVRLGLGTSAPKDLPAVMRSNEFNKFITTLYGFHNGVYNQLRDIGHQFRYDRKVGKMTYAGILTVIVPAVLGNMLTGRGPGDEEGLGEWAAKKSLIFAADTIPILRSIASSMEGGHDVQFSPVESVLQKGAKAAMEATAVKDDKDWLGVAIDSGEAAGLIAGVPGSHQVVKTLRYLKRWNEGKVENPNPWNAIVGGGR